MNHKINTSPVALITGSARRIGAEIARILHENGMNVVIHYHTSQKEAETLCQHLNEKRPDSAQLSHCDLTDIQKIPAWIDNIAGYWKRLDVVINNASRFYKTPLGNTTDTAWNELMNNNLMAPFFISQAAKPYLSVQKGCIINIADIHAERPMRDYAVYCISKSGLIMLTKALAKEWGPEIRVNAISPGAIAWPEGSNTLSSAEKEKILARIPLQKEGCPHAIAQSVLFIVKNADYITGQVLTVDGGRSLSI